MNSRVVIALIALVSVSTFGQVLDDRQFAEELAACGAVFVAMAAFSTVGERPELVSEYTRVGKEFVSNAAEVVGYDQAISVFKTEKDALKARFKDREMTMDLQWLALTAEARLCLSAKENRTNSRAE